MIKFSPKCGIFYQNDSFSLQILNSVKQYLNQRSSNIFCEYREITIDSMFEYSDDLCHDDVSILLIGGDTIYTCASNILCRSPHFFVYDMSPRSINNPLNYGSQSVETYYYSNFIFTGSSFPFLDNEGSRKLKSEIEIILGDSNYIMFEDFVSMYIYIILIFC